MYIRIRSLREDKDLTQTQIAQVLNCSQRIYSNYERGDVDIPTPILINKSRCDIFTWKKTLKVNYYDFSLLYAKMVFLLDTSNLIVLMKLSQFHNVSVDYLLDLTNENKPYKRS